MIFIHSENDKIVPLSSTQKLANIAGEKVIHTKKGGHNIDEDKIRIINKLI